MLAGGTDFYPARVGRRRWTCSTSPASPCCGGIGAEGGRLAARRLHDLEPTDRRRELPPLFDGLKQAAREVGGRQIQNAGTVAGNLCNASPAADGVPPLLALDAEVELARPRRHAARCRSRQFIPGNRRTALAPGELLVAIHVPQPRADARSALPQARRAALPGDLDRHGRRRRSRSSDGRVAARAGRRRRLLAGGAAPAGARGGAGRRAGRRRSAGRVEPRTSRRSRRSTTCAAAPPIAATPRSPLLRAPAGAGLARHEGSAFTLNGQRPAGVATAPPVTRLAGVLRDDLGLTGTKVGCDAGDCGACTVLLDGGRSAPAWSPWARSTGRAVETVEGLARGRRAAALQKSFLAHGAAQCGICTPGMLMAAQRPAAPNADADARRGRGRAGRRALPLHRLPQDRRGGAGGGDAGAPAAAPAAGAARRRAPRRGSTACAKVDGRATCSAPTPCRPMRSWLRVVRSPHAARALHARRPRAAAARRPGLVRVLTAADVPCNGFGIYPDIKDQPVLADGEVRYRGEAVLALVGDARRRCWRSATRRCRSPGRPSRRCSASTPRLAPDAPLVQADRPDNVLLDGGVRARRRRDGARGLRRRGRGRCSRPASSSTPISSPRPAGRERGRRPHRDPSPRTQTPYMDRDEVAQRACGSRPRQVRIVPTACGGGFGGKLDLSVQPLLAVAAWKLGRPVRCVYTRPESMAATTKRHPGADRGASSAAMPTGRLTGLRRSTATSTPAPMPPGGRPSPTACRSMPWGPTACRNVRHLGARPSSPTTRRPAPSAASACRRRPSRTRR